MRLAFTRLNPTTTPMHPAQVAAGLRTTLSLSSDPLVDVDGATINVDHAQLTETQRTAAQVAIDAYQHDPEWDLAPALTVPLSISLLSVPGGQVWTNMPAAAAEVFGTQALREWVDLSGARQVRLGAVVLVAGFAGSRLGMQYAPNAGGPWNFLDGGTGPQVPIDVIGAQVGPWVRIAPAARGDVLLRVGGIGGNGTLDPSFSRLGLQVR